MTNGLFRTLVLARAMAVEPIARAICADPVDVDMLPFAQDGDRWREVAQRAAHSSPSMVAHDAAIDADGADFP